MLTAQKQAILSAITALSFITPGFAAADTQSGSAETPPASVHIKLPDGLYFVLRWHYDKDRVGAPAENEVLLVDDFHFLEPLEREPAEYVILKIKSFIPISLAGAPLEGRDETTGKPRLRIELTDQQKQPLAQFTKEHLGGLLAIVIGGDIVTKHKIRGVISDGKIQITRCTQHGCKVLYSSLLNDCAKKPI